jgi:superfamily I DNA/RNA helicase
VSDGSYFAGGVLVKNCQDLNPRFASVVARQKAQVVYVGDSNQQLYEFRQAIDALASVSVERRAMLTISFRFGQGIADVANTILDQIPAARLRLTGQGPESTIGAAKDPDAILTRTNAGAIEAVLGAIEAGRRPHLVGGGAEIERFAKAAQDLMSDPPIPVEHPELAVFTSWGEVQTYVANDALGVELRLLVRLIDKYGVETVLKAVANSTPEASADVVISTVHKAKGREWGTVRLGSDFPYKADAEPNDAENRLCYVAATRAKRHLDFTVCAPIAALFADEVPPSSLADAPETARTSIPPAFVRVSGITSIMSGAKS